MMYSKRVTTLSTLRKDTVAVHGFSSSFRSKCESNRRSFRFLRSVLSFFVRVQFSGRRDALPFPTNGMFYTVSYYRRGGSKRVVGRGRWGKRRLPLRHVSPQFCAMSIVPAHICLLPSHYYVYLIQINEETNI